MVAESTEAMLENENVVRGIDGFYEKVNLKANKPSKPQESENIDTNK